MNTKSYQTFTIVLGIFRVIGSTLETINCCTPSRHDLAFVTHCVHIPDGMPLDTYIFIFAEEGNRSSPRKVQDIFLASCNFLHVFLLPTF